MELTKDMPSKKYLHEHFSDTETVSKKQYEELLQLYEGIQAKKKNASKQDDSKDNSKENDTKENDSKENDSLENDSKENDSKEDNTLMPDETDSQISQSETHSAAPKHISKDINKDLTPSDVEQETSKKSARKSTCRGKIIKDNGKDEKCHVL